MLNARFPANFYPIFPAGDAGNSGEQTGHLRQKTASLIPDGSVSPFFGHRQLAPIASSDWIWFNALPQIRKNEL
jgi:hypothetical protein